MRHLNYNHMLYFWTVAREGSVARAAGQLNLTPQTVSGQIKRLEESLGAALFERNGRALMLTDTGKVVAQFADEIFPLGQELAQFVRHGGRPSAPRTLTVGVVHSIPKLVSYHLLSPALTAESPTRLILHQGSLDELLAQLAVHRIDLVLADTPAPPDLNVRARSHEVGECSVAFFAAPKLARQLADDFPRSLHGAPMLMPGARTVLRERVQTWLLGQDIAPAVVAEIDDSGLLKAFGHSGAGVFVGPSVVASAVCDAYGVEQIGTVDEIVERFYAILPERRMPHPAVTAISEQGRKCLQWT
jgi:LysR family transcriptional activator of nhaA